MKVVFSRRVENELAALFERGIAMFGHGVAERTYHRLRRALIVSLAERPRLGVFLPKRQVFRLVVAHTPFVAYYRFDERAKTITILAIFHRGQKRREFER